MFCRRNAFLFILFAFFAMQNFAELIVRKPIAPAQLHVIKDILTNVSLTPDESQDLSRLIAEAKIASIQSESDDSQLPNKKRLKRNLSQEFNAVAQCTDQSIYTPSLLEKKSANTPKKSRKNNPIDLKISPIKSKKHGGCGRLIRKDAVYAIFVTPKMPSSLGSLVKNGFNREELRCYFTEEEGKEYFPAPRHSERINFDDLVKTFLNKSEKQKYDQSKNEINFVMSEELRNKVFAEIEYKVRGWVRSNEFVFKRITYVGISNNTSKRFYGHKQDLKVNSDVNTTNINDDSVEYYHELLNKKANYFSYVDGIDKDEKDIDQINVEIIMSSLVYNVPPAYLKTVEVFLGWLLMTTHKASAKLGDEKARKQIEEYLNSQERKDSIKATDKLHLHRLRQEFVKKSLFLK